MRLFEAEPLLLTRIAIAEEFLCCLDFDGTLAPLAPTPEEARPLSGTAALLAALLAAPATSVAVVSGRPIAELRRMLDVDGIHWIGVHGLQIQPPRGVAQFADAALPARAALQEIKRQLERDLAGRTGFLLEDKEVALACHYRLASRADAAVLRERAARLAARYSHAGVELGVIEGIEVIEVLPNVANKGKAVCDLRGGREGVLTLYAGDDRTDEDVFIALPTEAITIRVGPPESSTAARYSVASPADLQRFLANVVRSRANHRHSAPKLQKIVAEE